jgi:endonuclease-3
MASKEKERQRVAEIRDILDREYPNATCTLEFSTPLELLVATILAAQCTDERVNRVTRSLFKTYKNAADYAEAPQEELEEAVRPTGYYRNKSKAIRGCCAQIVQDFAGHVPEEMDALVSLKGIGRKTANLIRGSAFDRPGIVVDTHVKRVSRRLGLTKKNQPVRIEQDLCAVIPTEAWTKFSWQLIYHGRRLCTARKPRCRDCTLSPLCPAAEL